VARLAFRGRVEAVSGRGGRGGRGEGFPGVRGHPLRRRSSRRSSAGGLDVLPERVIIQAKRLGRRVRPVLPGRFHRQGLKFLGDTRATLASPPPTIETPPNRRQPNGDVVCGSGSHLPSSTQSCADSRRYQTLHDDSCRLAGRTQPAGAVSATISALAPFESWATALRLDNSTRVSRPPPAGRDACGGP